MPERDIRVPLAPAHESAEAQMNPVSLGEGPPALDPRTGFAAHTSPGEVLSLNGEDGRVLEAAGSQGT